MRLSGQCHCGAVTARIEGVAAADLGYRACQCGFCAGRAAATTSHPDARVTIAAAPDALSRYRFGQKLSDFLICRRCGTYVGAVAEIDGALYGILNARGVNLSGFAGRTPEPMTYDGETPEARSQRRKARWSPAAVTALQTSA